MDLTSFYPLLYMLSINPNRSQFFRYDYISLTCAPSKWTVKRNTSQRTSQTCNRDFGALQQSSCNLMNVYPSDSGVYWCESEQKQRSNILNITVAAGPVILEMPPLPVTEGDEVVLRCSFKEKSTPKSPSFYKNDVFIGTESEGKMILPAVSKSDEGFYKCQHPTEGESPQSFLAVIVKPQGSPSTHPPSMVVTKHICIVLLVSLYIIIFIVCLFLYCVKAKVQAQAERRESVLLPVNC
ncbi:low affinity immunoglobulin gamma Fc region receptor II-c-like isoform X2 [Mastacembelus armatus]|uniref:low affinity immunoglobulin gamma Fc region receptor II-c-like isoform X2 n=1 Tax=Mastacembelus armatus TaxID=205130 RepID=UPI000E457EB6|nr:low affinity immunoglobulin gamma Fc region receptor II-c-like isoform X2 [Mastacembelus armatus]